MQAEELTSHLAARSSQLTPCLTLHLTAAFSLDGLCFRSCPFTTQCQSEVLRLFGLKLGVASGQRASE